MASRRNLGFGTFISLIEIGLMFGASQGARYTVGNGTWGIPVYPDFYSHWSSSIVLYLGDYIVFEFLPEFSNVLQVPMLDYEECTSSNAVKYLPNSPAIIDLNEVGVFYYLSNISDYCRLGQKVTVTVHPLPGPTSPPPPHLGPVPAPLSHPSSQPVSPIPELAPSPVVAPGRSDGDAPSPGHGEHVPSKNIGSIMFDYYGLGYWPYSALFGLLFIGF